MKKILIFSHEFPPALGGAGSVACNIAREAKRKSYSVDILTLSFIRKLKIPKTLKKVILWMWPLAYAPYLFWNARKYDLIICNDGVSIFCAGLYLNKECLEKVVCIIHGVEPLLDTKNFKSKLIFFDKVYRFCFDKCRTVVFVSEFIMLRFEKYFSLEPYGHKLKVIHNGIDKAFFDCNLKGGDFYKKDNICKLLTVSRLVKGKGYDRVFDALQLLKEKNSFDFIWTIVGDGGYFDEFKRKVEKSILNKNIIFLGKKKHEDLPSIYVKHNIFILLTELEESFGLVYLEAAHCGCYVIGSCVGGVSEAFNYIQHGDLIPMNTNASQILEAIFKAELVSKNERLKNNVRDISSFFNELINE